MELSGVELRYLVNEIKNSVIKGYYASNITAITKESFLFKLHHSTEPDIILMLSTRGIWITRLKFKQVEENMLLSTIKNELERSKIESIEQIGSERVITVKFKLMDGKFRTIVGEFFGQGNIILCDESMQILAILNPIEVRHRTLKTGFRYTPPPVRGIDVFDLSVEQLGSMRSAAEKDLDVLRWIGRNISLPKKFVEEVAKRAEVAKMKVAQLSDEDLNKIYAAIRGLVTDITEGGKDYNPIIITGVDGKAEDALPIITDYAATKSTFKRATSYMEAVDEVLSRDILDVGRNIRTIEMANQIAILEHDLDEQNKAKEKVISKSFVIRKLATELMTLSYRGVDNFNDDLIKQLLTASSAVIINEKGMKFLEVADERIQIGYNNLPKVASLLFSRAKEMERGSDSIDEAKAMLLARIDKLQSRKDIIHNKIVIKQYVSKEWYERYRWFITTDGLLAVGGRDSSSNSALIRKHLTEQDIVFHAEIYGSPFFIIKNSSAVSQIEKSLYQAAQATVCFSRAWKDGLYSADAYWVKADQIKKGAPTGQFLPKGSFVIEGKRNYIKGIEIRLAIGLMEMSNNKKYALVCGPADAIKKRSLIYSIMTPSGTDPMNIARKIKSEFVKASADDIELAGFIKSISADEFIRTIPYGRSKVSLTERGEGKRASPSSSAAGGTSATSTLSSSAQPTVVQNEQSN
jgi:predicted ribosome quality control (RQC) complex YloA/Tae2 family protein